MTDRLPKRTVAIVLSYSGIGYHGMQANEGIKTIEGDVFAAMVKANMVSKDNADKQSKICFQRAARTDKGVSAAGQLINAKLIMMNTSDAVKDLNDHLPPSIRVWSVIPVMGSFNAKNFCSGRTYEYLVPTHVFKKFKEWNPDTFEKQEFKVIRGERDLSYRLSDSDFVVLQKMLNRFVGTHNFFNFTIGKKSMDPSCQRYISSFTASKPFMEGELEWISLKVQGQSFMMHQIRKMVGLCILALKANVNEEIVSFCLKSSEKLSTPKSPGQSLLLERCFFDVYNRKATKFNRDPLELKMEGINQFKHNVIYKEIFEMELKENLFQNWLDLIEQDLYSLRYIKNL